ncbi:MAG TPA: hypothetical protein VHO23_03155 [Candidatus Paceibacterota bacterium]|nr:hypothetical protein [Candidatus Paceibacterota bacterium]
MKNRKRKLWFSAKKYGWGWYPITWEGWLITLLYMVLFIGSAFLFGVLAPAAVASGGSILAGTVLLGSFMLLLTASLLWLCYRYGEEPRWRWGKD